MPNSKEHFVNKVKFSGVINGKIIEGTPNFSSPEPFRGVTFGPAREVEIFSEPLKLEIKELEQDIFPAKKVLLSETYEYEKGGFFTNKPIKRNVTATVFGSSPEVVADMVSKDVEGFNVYPSETSKAVEEVDGENAIVIKKTFVYVPIKEGFLKIPDLKYEWYNVDYQQNQETVLLGREIGVSKNPDETGSSQDIVLEKIPSSPMVVNKNPTSVSNVEVINDDKGFINVLGNKYEESKFYRLISIIILFGLMIFYAFKDRLKIKKVRFTKKKKDEGLNEFYRAVSLNDAKLTATSLIAFADKIMPADAPHNLEKVGLLFGGNASLMEEIKKLNQVLYFENNNDWNGANLAILIKKFLKIAKLKSDAKKEKDNKKDDNLPSLYLK
ncbi:MAG: hypothetical protein BWY78_01246 [Alphaproteobacteria bacterium ADurb.Bin438]|nr:MAG: hypothetical protein BWY78_01246 [Alphaproteobacteria bacterium ADurb.Bin438]